MRDLAAIKRRYDDAVEKLTEKFRRDPNIEAVLLMGSLSYDTVWERSDVDMSIIVKDQKLDAGSFCVDEDGLNINVDIIQRSQFRRGFEKASGGSVWHSMFAKGRIIYTADPTISEYFEELRHIGQDDMELSLLHMSGDLIGTWEKCQKWLYVRQDLAYTQFYVLKGAEAMARMEVCCSFEPPTREAILRALELSPAIFEKVYTQAMRGQMSEAQLEECIGIFDSYLESKLELFTRPVLAYMDDGEIKTLSQLARFLKIGAHGMVHIMDYLTEKGVADRVSQTIRITPKSRKNIEEIAYIYLKK